MYVGKLKKTPYFKGDIPIQEQFNMFRLAPSLKNFFATSPMSSDDLSLIDGVN